MDSFTLVIGNFREYLHDCRPERKICAVAPIMTFFLLLFSGCGEQPLSRWSQADFIFTNGTVVTVDETFSRVEAIAVRDGLIAAAGSESEVLLLRGPATRLIDMQGKTAIPGIQDSHIHFLSLGNELRYQAELTLARNAEDVIDAVNELKNRLNPAPGEWIRGQRWDQYKYDEMFTRWQLDEISPDNPVMLDRVYRGVAVNTAVFRMMGIDDNDPSTWPDWWLNDPANFTFEDRILRMSRQLNIGGRTVEYNVPTGVFIGSRASRLVTVRTPGFSFDELVESVGWGAEEMLRLGVTSIVDPSSRMGYVMDVYQEVFNRGLFNGLRVSAVYEGTFHTDPPEEIRAHLDEIKVNNLGDSFLKWRGSKFYADGGAGTRSAWVSETFERWQEFEGKENYGIPVMADNAIREAQYRAAVDYGWELHTHTCGDIAMRQSVDLYMKLMGEIREENPDADLRWSLIHAYLPLESRTRVLEDMVDHGIIACCNPVFQWQEGSAFAVNLGIERMNRTQPFRSYINAGVMLASGSDFGVTSHDPWIGIYALLTRRDQASGNVYGQEETLDIEDALRTYTINGAYLTYEEDFKGSLEAGKAADLVVIDLPDINALEENPELCFEMKDRILLTMTDGKVRYRKEGFQY
ncbi:amidohydrolase [candidate division KSB1 bacterium]